MTKTFAERCHIAQQSLPDAQYKAMLTALHTEMLAALAEQPAPMQSALDEMWITLASYQPQATANGHGETWAAMCREKTSEDAVEAGFAADAAHADVADVDVAYAAARAASADAVAIGWAKEVIARIGKAKESKPAKLAEQPAPVQEPEWYHFVRRGEDFFVPYEGQAPANATRLYTTPQAQPSREWVGLTEEEKTELRRKHYPLPLLLMDATEAKLKEKNHD